MKSQSIESQPNKDIVSIESQSSNQSNLQPITQNCQKWQFPDKLTYQLYSILANSRVDSSEMEQAERITALNSHFHQEVVDHLASIKEKSYFKKGYQLRANIQDTSFLKNKSYSIVSSSLNRKKTMTQSDFKKIYENNPKFREIIYKQSKFRGDKQLPTTGKKLIQQQQKQHQTIKQARQISVVFASQFVTLGTQTNEVRVEPVKAKPYKFRKLSRRNNFQFQSKELTCNIFNIIDPLFQNNPLEKNLNRSFQPIAKPIKLRPWKAK